jgi:hypothetical protein
MRSRVVFCTGLRFVSNDRHSLSFDCSGIHSVQQEEQQQFYVQITGMNGSDAANAFDVVIQTLDETKEYYKDEGEYLPLSVWLARGFDAVGIKERSRDSDVMECPVLGTVYRVRILQKGNSGSRGTVTARTLKRKPPPRALSNSGAGSSGAGSSGDGGHMIGGDGPLAIEPPPMQALQDGRASSDDDSSSTTASDSSSSDNKKKKKNKKGKKSKKNKKDKKDKKNKKDKKDKKAPKDV